MREILFRGKLLYSEKWIFGDLIKKGEPSDKEYVIADDNVEGHWTFGIQAETVGQFTGITDRDGAKIFEGDIIRVSCGKITGTGTVEFRDGMFGIEWGWHKDFTGFRDFANPLFEVIGNIYDEEVEK